MFSGFDHFHDQSILAISPHPDDLALSVGSFLSGLVRVARVECLTVFTRSVWAPYRDGLSEADTTLWRREEEASFWRKLGIPGQNLDLEDAGVRGYDAATELTADHQADPIVSRCRAEMQAVIQSRPWHWLLIPAGIGNHIDHLIAREAARRARPPRSRLLMYEEMPYAANLTETAIDETIHAVFPHARPFRHESEELIREKNELCKAYPSQVADMELQAVAIHARRLGRGEVDVERLWMFP